MDIQEISPENRPTARSNRLPRGRLLFTLIAGVVLLGGLAYLGAMEHTIAINNPFVRGASPAPSPTPDPDYLMPEKESNRLDVLVLGIRGENDPDADTGGPLLTDSIQVFSYDKTTKKSSLISLPRDLFVKLSDSKNDKLNTVYEYGVAHHPDALRFTKDKFSEITGVYIDQVVVFDFSSFKDIVDALGGIDITLAAPFNESQQWGYSFSLPAGKNHLNGQTALYYARSRYSSNDFDRSRRQQEIIFAIKDKLMQLNFFTDPVKSFSVLNLIRNDIQTDIGVWDIKQFLDLANEVRFDQMKRSVVSTDNLLKEGRDHGAYILLPKTGTFAEMKRFFQDSLK